eukprot:TRINITY_DN3466_c0_g4_i1.p1 TRINITY_DN3466_c0_g4~~TRINITY_DN3466_c0_g4_i1.p1  ORF type:complete len:654 (+),score=242.95 TRINITY_DN3466_c0_g4_i1:111-2072(+)
MVLSMLSVIQNVSKHRKTESPPVGPDEKASTSSATSLHTHPIAEMSRRKQRNPKPFFSSNEDDETNEMEDSKRENESSQMAESGDGAKVDEGGGSEDGDRDSPRDLSSLVKVEVIEHPVTKSPSPPMAATITASSSSSSFTPSPPMTITSLPPLTPMPPLGQSGRIIPEDFAAKNNMFHFGDVIVAHHPDTAPVPMVIPMVYLYPLQDKREGGIRYRMLVPLNGGPPPPPELLIPPNIMRMPSPPQSKPRRTVKKESPLDLSKSPPGGEACSPSSPHLSGGLASKEIEAQLNFLKVKHLEFIKSQQQPPPSASRCEDCNINFSKHQNYVAHKKYYCSGGVSHPPPKAEEDPEPPTHHIPQRKPPSSPPKRSVAAAAVAALGLLGISSATSPPRPSSSFDPNKELLLLKQQQELLSKEVSSSLLSGRDSEAPPQHFVCEGCGIKFKSVNNLQAHQARYCAGLRKAEEMNSAFEAMIKSSPGLPPLSPADMMSFLNAKSMEAKESGNASSGSSSTKEDFCCILCGYKEDSLDKLKDHINMHFIGQVKRSRSSSASSSNQANGASENRSEGGNKSPEPAKKRVKLEEDSSSSPVREKEESSASPPRSKSITPTNSVPESGSSSMRCESCDIGFSQLSNFIAHKKYYCRGIRSTSSP